VRFRPRMHGLAGALVAAALGLGAPPSVARGQAPRGPTFDVDVADTMLIGVGLWATGFGIGRQAHRFAETPACRTAPEAETGLCDRSRIFALDRPTFTHTWRGADAASDVLLVGMVFSPFAYTGARVATDDRVDEVDRTFGRSASVAFQALGAVALATNVLKMVVRRPRPLTYDAHFSREERFDGDARLSFPSGHTSMAFGAATVIAVMAHEELSNPDLRVAAIAGSFGAATAVGYLRIAARKHFLTDVLAGAALGSGVAWLVAGTQLADDAGSGDPGGATAGWRFTWGGTF